MINSNGLGNEEGQLYYSISDFKAEEENQLDLREGDEVRILEEINDTWWWVELGGVAGYVPTNHLLPCKQSADSEDQWQDGEYFSNYDTLKLHLEMLHDKSRTTTYRKAIEEGKDNIKNKVVLDLGCGTGILSLFCAKLGNARKVYAVDASSISEKAAQVVECNGFSERVEVIQCKGEDLDIPEKVDLIISEWMGTLLLFELMLESVLITRDRCLKPDGVMWPSDAELFLVPCSAAKVHSEQLHFWKDVYGFDFSPLIPLAKEEMLGRPIYNHVMDKEDCLSAAVSIMKLNLKTLTIGELETNSADFSFNITRPGVVHGFGSWFEVTFGGFPDATSEPVVLSTSPHAELTHWKQDLFVMDDSIPVLAGDTISGSIEISRNPHWRRHLRVEISFTHFQEATKSKEYRKHFKLWK